MQMEPNSSGRFPAQESEEHSIVSGDVHAGDFHTFPKAMSVLILETIVYA